MRINKANIINLVKKKTNFETKDARLAVNSTISAITDMIKNGNDIEIRGLGVFEIKQTKPKRVYDLHIKTNMSFHPSYSISI